MIAPPLPANEAARLHALERMDLAGAGRDERCERYARLARVLADTPIAAVSVVGPDNQWFRGAEGLAVDGTPRAVSFCGHAILHRDIFHVPDATQDPRFSDNPLVTGDPHIRLYAGFPVFLPGDIAVGTVCVIDRRPRALAPGQLAALRDLADCLQGELATLLSVADMDDVARELFRMLPGQPRKRG